MVGDEFLATGTGALKIRDARTLFVTCKHLRPKRRMLSFIYAQLIGLRDSIESLARLVLLSCRSFIVSKRPS